MEERSQRCQGPLAYENPHIRATRWLPPYSPELNPIERVWLFLRERFLSFRLFRDQDDIVEACCRAWNALVEETGRIRSLCDQPWLPKVSP